MAIFYFLLFCYLLDLITFGIEQAFQDLHSRRVLINTAAGLTRLAEMNAGQCPQLETFSRMQARFLFTPGEMPGADPKSISLHESSHGNITESRMAISQKVQNIHMKKNHYFYKTECLGKTTGKWGSENNHCQIRFR